MQITLLNSRVGNKFYEKYKHLKTFSRRENLSMRFGIREVLWTRIYFSEPQILCKMELLWAVNEVDLRV